MQQFITECKDRIGVDVQQSMTFVKAVIIKKKHYFGVTTNCEIKVVGMEGKKMTDLHELTKCLTNSSKTLRQA